ncbi:hypothetical protein K9B33_20835 [Sphingobium sp. 3R8]|uniref:hypothetical protein n=1 Tax=Sphingobium sp. 3R8 TaxID=2874921 RepID=UPI001CCAA47F|nr:hypothetical protein [Sphingobium sp. 3R8]MBZ9649984.1 hypothetical protein [Sphingobium sp. 3R8]
MTLWEYLDRVGERRARLALGRPINLRMLANVIGVALISGFLGALFALFIIPIPKGNEQIVTYMIGQLSGFAGGIVAYHYTQKAGDAELDAKRTATTSKLADAVIAVSGANSPGAAGVAADQVADAAVTAADAIKGKS